MSIQKKLQSPWVRYGLAVAVVVLATGIRLLLNPWAGNRFPLAAYLFAIMVVAWVCGSGPTVLAIFLSMISSAYFFMEPRQSFVIVNPLDQVSLLVFMSVGLFIAFLREQLNQARERGIWHQRERESQQALKESERRFRQLAESMPQMVWTVGPDLMADYYNERWYQYTGLDPNAQGDESWKPAFHPDDIARTQSAWDEAAASGDEFQVEYRMKDCRTGDYRWHLGRAVPARDEAGKIVQWFGTSTDIDDQKRVEEKLREAHDNLDQKVKERTLELTRANQNLSKEIEERREMEVRLRESENNLRLLAAQLTTTEDTERRRLATDLHDSIGQSLSLLKLNLEPLAHPLADLPDSQKRFTTALVLLDGIIQQTRTLMFELYPAMLHDLGLVPTLHWYSEQLNTQAQVIVSESGKAIPLPPPLASDLFRATKETLGNAVRHGRAREIYVSVHWRADNLKIVIDDDGCGFDPISVASSKGHRGLGLAGIKERLASCQGKMLVESEAGQGARVIMEVPLSQVDKPLL